MTWVGLVAAALLIVVLIERECWSTELLESHFSFPVLSYYRSQHENPSWFIVCWRWVGR